MKVIELIEKWNDSAASDANGRWAKYRDGKIGVDAMATWLYNSRVHKNNKADKLKSAMGAISQQQNTSKLISAAKADALRAALKKKYGVTEEVVKGINEAFKLKDKVKIVKGPKDVVGKEGFIGEIRTYVTGKKYFTIDYKTDSGRETSVMLTADQIRNVKE